MTDVERIAIEIATKIRLAAIEKDGFSKDPFYTRQSVKQAKEIVMGVLGVEA